MTTHRGQFVKFDMNGLSSARAAIELDLHQNGNGPVAQMLNKWVARYAAFTRRRFNQLSRSKGGGEWPPLAESTILSRSAKGGGTRAQRLHAEFRKRSRAKTAAAVMRSNTRMKQLISGEGVSILRDTGTLFNATEVGRRGNLKVREHGGIRYGFSGRSRHGRQGKASIRDIAVAHNTGEGRLPKRVILAVPDQPTMGGMNRDFQQAVSEVLNRADMRRGGTS